MVFAKHALFSGYFCLDDISPRHPWSCYCATQPTLLPPDAPQRRPSVRRVRRRVLWLAPQAACAQGRLEARHEASLAGIPVGKGTWNIEIGEDTFSASAQGGTAGLLKALPAAGVPAPPRAASSVARWWPMPIPPPPPRRKSPRPSAWCWPTET